MANITLEANIGRVVIAAVEVGVCFGWRDSASVSLPVTVGVREIATDGQGLTENINGVLTRRNRRVSTRQHRSCAGGHVGGAAFQATVAATDAIRASSRFETLVEYRIQLQFDVRTTVDVINER